jgi:DNA-binding winged helix-turn-helix (wHTH) protein
MHIAVLALSPEFAESVKSAFGRDAHRYSTFVDWPSLSACVEAEHPALAVIQRTALGAIPLADVAQLHKPGAWPPVLISGQEIARVVRPLGSGIWPLPADPPRYQIGDLQIDTRRKRATIGQKWVALPPIQYRLLLALARREGEVLNAQELLRVVWGYDASPIEARELVKVHIRQIRRRLGLDPQTHHYIRSVRGFGYVLAAPDEDAA